MKKAILFIACFVVAIVSLSSFTDRASAPVKGYRVPELSLDTDSGKISLAEFRGDYLIVSFWSSSDASSRLRCNDYTALATHQEGLHHIAVNFDRSETLFNEVVKRDNLVPGMQYHVEGKKATRIIDDFHLDRGLRSFLVNPKGKIIAIDPDVESLTKLAI